MWHLTKPLEVLQSKDGAPNGTSTVNIIIKNCLPPMVIVPTVMCAPLSLRSNLNWEFGDKSPELKHNQIALVLFQREEWRHFLPFTFVITEIPFPYPVRKRKKEGGE